MRLAHPDRGAAQALAALDAAGLGRGCVLSPGYRRAPACQAAPCAAQRGWTQAMNDWTLAQAASAPSRLLLFCGVPLSAPWAPSEVARCAQAGGRGLKLHPVSEGLSLRQPATAERLERVLKAAAAAKLPVLIHVDMASADEVKALFALAGAVPTAQVIAAHQIAPNLALLPQAPPNVWTELSGLTLLPPAAVPAFVAVWRAFGVQRILLGSDWPTLNLTPKAHVARLREAPLSAQELERIVDGNGQRLLPGPQP